MYAKLFTSLYQGTLRGRSNEILVFTNLLAHADRDGVVDMHWRAIAEEVGLSEEQVKAACKQLEAPDPESRSPDEQGARIVPLDPHRAWGWVIVNYKKYRAIRNEDDRREQVAAAVARFRARKAGKSTDIPGKPVKADVIHGKPRKSHAEAEAKAEAGVSGACAPSSAGADSDERLEAALKTRRRKGVTVDRLRRALACVGTFWDTFPKIARDRSTKYDTALALIDLQATPADAVRIKAAAEVWGKSHEWTRDGGTAAPGVHRWLKTGKWREGEEVPVAAGEVVGDSVVARNRALAAKLLEGVK